MSSKSSSTGEVPFGGRRLTSFSSARGVPRFSAPQAGHFESIDTVVFWPASASPIDTAPIVRTAIATPHTRIRIIDRGAYYGRVGFTRALRFRYDDLSSRLCQTSG